MTIRQSNLDFILSSVPNFTTNQILKQKIKTDWVGKTINEIQIGEAEKMEKTKKKP